MKGAVKRPYPMLVGRNRQSLPQIPGAKYQFKRYAIRDNEESDVHEWEAWLVPRRAGSEKTMVITMSPDTHLAGVVERWPSPENNEKLTSRNRSLRRAERLLSEAPVVFSTEASIYAAYRRLAVLWADESLEEGDPQGDLLLQHARRLRTILDDLCKRPRTILRTEHRMLKLQNVRRTSAKSVRWLTGQPGRNTAERAGARQRIKAPKRSETHSTLENSVLRAFAKLTERESDNWLRKHKAQSNLRTQIHAHGQRARRLRIVLEELRVPEARPPIIPNFPLRFDQRYREIWRAWQELRNSSRKTENDWMWQDRTFMELLALRAAMTLHNALCERSNRSGSLFHCPLLLDAPSPNQGRYLGDKCITAAFGIVKGKQVTPIVFRSGDDVEHLGSLFEAAQKQIAWNDDCFVIYDDCNDPWNSHVVDKRLSNWANTVVDGYLQ